MNINDKLLESCNYGQLRRVKKFLKKGADANTINNSGYTPLIYASRGGYDKIVKLLVSHGANVNAKTKFGDTSLIYALRKGNVEICELLIANGANVNLCDKEGKTPLHEACYIGNLSIAKLLIEKGADLSPITSNNNSPIDLAIKKKHKDVINYLNSFEEVKNFYKEKYIACTATFEITPDDSELINGNRNTKNQTIEKYKRSKDWFVFIEDSQGNNSFYTKNNFSHEIQNRLINGNLNSNTKIEGHFKNNEKKWEFKNTSIREFIKDFYKLRNLYEPIWNNALTGLKWGAIIGIGLKLIDTAILFRHADPLLALLFIGAIGLLFIPKIGTIGMIIAVILLNRLTEVNLYLAAISAALIGGILGCLPGMCLGGLYGLIRRNSIPKAHDAEPENISVILKAIILPFIGGISLILTYIYIFNPWLQSVLE